MNDNTKLKQQVQQYCINFVELQMHYSTIITDKKFKIYNKILVYKISVKKCLITFRFSKFYAIFIKFKEFDNV